MTQVQFDGLTPGSAETLMREHELVHVMLQDSAGREQKRFTWNKGMTRLAPPLNPASAKPQCLTQLDLIVSSPEQFNTAKALAERIKGQIRPPAPAAE
jgi:hypothetical protein